MHTAGSQPFLGIVKRKEPVFVPAILPESFVLALDEAHPGGFLRPSEVRLCPVGDSVIDEVIPTDSSLSFDNKR